MRNKYLLGVNNDNEFVFGEFEITERNGYPEFSASFDSVRPFSENSFDAEEWAKIEVDNMNKEWKYDLCERYDCAPSELAKEIASEYNDPRDTLMDCSLFPECYEINDEFWYFESSSCGQYDSRETGMTKYINKEAYDLLHELWDKYHLKKADDTCKVGYERVVELLKDTDEESWIKDYIKNNL